MGIRESFQENPPGEKDLNIHDISIEGTEEKPYVFDLENEVTDKEWEAMKALLKREREAVPGFDDQGVLPRGDRRYISRQLLKMKILFPERADELDLDEQLRRGIRYDLNENLKYDDQKRYSADLVKLKILFGERPNNDIIEREQMKVGGYIELEPKKSWDKIREHAVMFAIICPERIRGLLDKYKEAWQGMKQILDQAHKAEAWDNFSKIAMEMRLLFPDKTKELGLDAKAWRRMKEKLEEFRVDGALADFFRQAMNMKILAAKKVRVTDAGIECVMSQHHGGYKEKKSKRPERRQF